MPTDPQDISQSMPASAAFAAPPDRSAYTPLTQGAFADRFEAASRTFWCIAFSILRDREIARDVVQESAIIALRKVADFDPSTSFVAWMGQIVRFSAMNEVRRRSRRRESAGPDAADNLGTPASAAGPAGGDFDEHVTAALNELEETARACLLMKVVVGMEYKDISDALGIPEGTAMSHVFRARKLMRARLAATHGPDGSVTGQEPDSSSRGKGGPRP